jgi:hypothetical protein
VTTEQRLAPKVPGLGEQGQQAVFEGPVLGLLRRGVLGKSDGAAAELPAALEVVGADRDPHTLKFTGEDKDMTLDELDEFVKAARGAGVPGGNPVRAELSMSRKIKEVEIVGCRAGGSRRVAPCTLGRRPWGVSTSEVGLRCGLLTP